MKEEEVAEEEGVKEGEESMLVGSYRELVLCCMLSHTLYMSEFTRSSQ